MFVKVRPRKRKIDVREKMPLVSQGGGASGQRSKEEVGHLKVV